MSKMVKTYVLVDEEMYKRKIENRAKAESTPALPNPFQNPDAARAKKIKRQMYDIGQDKSLDAEQAARLFRQMMHEYESRIDKVTGKKRLRGVNNAPMIKPEPTASAKPQNGNVAITTTPKLPRKRLMSPERGSEVSPPPMRSLEPVVNGSLVMNDPKRRKPLPALEREKVPLLLGGHLSEADIDKSYPLLNEMFKVGLVHNGSIAPLKDSGFKMTAARAKSSIRDMLLSSPDRRSTTASEAEGLVNFFKRRGLQTTLTKPITRKSRRQKKSTPKK